MDQDRPYKVVNFFSIDTRYGRKLAVSLIGGASVILPKRFSDAAVDGEKINCLNQQNFNMIFRGVDVNKKNLIMIDFTKLEFD